jgi:hypothetical protein
LIPLLLINLMDSNPACSGINSHPLYRLSYRGMVCKFGIWIADFGIKNIT